MSNNIENNSLRVAWLFPDILHLYGERGNMLALGHMADDLGIDLKIDRVGLDTKTFVPDDYDIIFCQPGEIAVFPLVIEYLKPYKADLERFIDDGKVMFVTSTAQGIFGEKVVREDGSEIEGLGIINCEFKEMSMIYADDLYFTTKYGDGNEMEIFGSQIRMTDEISSEEQPFGEILYGYGNCGVDIYEGVLKKNSFFTNTTGPILALNPWLTAKILDICMKRKGESIDESKLDFSLAQKSLDAKKKYTINKDTRLTNCPYRKK